MSRRLVRNEEGVALVLALMAMVVLSTLAAGLLVVVSVNHRMSLESLDAKKAFGIAEVGLAYAEGNVYGAAAAHGTPTTGATTFTQDGGSGSYWATVAGDGHTWTMHGQGTYDGVTRQVSAQADVPSPVTVSNAGVWNYLYADSTSGTCPTTISGSNNTVISVPVLTRGNLCLQAPFTGAQLEVGGNLTVSGGKGQIGTSTSKIPNLYVGGTCNGVTAGTGVCNGTQAPIYATNATTALPVAPQMPPIDWANAYSTANPGPGAGHGCQTGSGAPTALFDNDTTLNNSDGSINLFPASPYDCINGANEIRWCPSVNATYHCTTANTLYINGTFFFDGSLNISSNAAVVYSGSGSLYFTGTIAVSGSSSLCGISGCTGAWNTDTSSGGAALVFVAACWANSTGSALVTSKCVSYGGNAVMQVATYCTTDYFIAGTASNWGPVLADTLQLNGNLSTLIPFHIMPPGTPLNTNTVYLPASAPTYWNG